ncbi:MAG: lysylphosphatidylglycerol synthase transmembrane domain-containing protein, partial [Alphaproteobacteria bacterium]|nr:lysylphosphatidylglycerol synthase transmembrane domain-containing protein [Alphaproteobacteria bacterium]
MFTNLGKICITGLLFYFLFQQIDASNVYLYLKSFSLTAIYLSILSVLFSTIVTSWRWHFILKSVGYDIPIKNCTTQIFKCYSISQFMPSNIGGDIYRII